MKEQELKGTVAKAHSDRSARDTSTDRLRLIRTHGNLVRSLAWQIRQRLPSYVEVDDLIADGHLGLVQAAQDYDATRGARFTTYAFFRIRGAILDGLAKRSWFSRAEYRARKYEQNANELLNLTIHDSDADWSDDLGESARWLGRMTGTLSVAYLASSVGANGQRRITLEDVSAAIDPSTVEPRDDLVDRELQEHLRDLVEHLSDPARSLIKRIYFDGMTLQEAAGRLGMSKSWASRLHARTLDRLARGLRLVRGHDV